MAEHRAAFASLLGRDPNPQTLLQDIAQVRTCAFVFFHVQGLLKSCCCCFWASRIEERIRALTNEQATASRSTEYIASLQAMRERMQMRASAVEMALRSRPELFQANGGARGGELVSLPDVIAQREEELRKAAKYAHSFLETAFILTYFPFQERDDLRGAQGRLRSL